MAPSNVADEFQPRELQYCSVGAMIRSRLVLRQRRGLGSKLASRTNETQVGV
jgi:hypothetical protein